MIYLNPILLFGLAAVAIPIIIHILNRRKAKVVDWGAMVFLEESLASRNRKILVEELILMALRCLLLAALVFALARPFLTTRRILADRAGDPQDVAIILDGSLSMKLKSGQPAGRSNFQNAIEEARQVVAALRPGDTVSLVLAGPTAQAVVPNPISDRQALETALNELTPVGGSMAVVDAMNAAVRTLAAGANPSKKIIVITDGQSLGWDLGNKPRWTALADEAGALPTKPVVLVRPLEMPREWKNVCLAGLTPARAIIGADRPVKLTVTVANTGVGAMEPQAVELSVDGKVVGTQPVGSIVEGAATSALFDHQFKRHGPHVVTARVLCEDDLPDDNATTRVVDVQRTLPVLVIEGRSSTRPLEGDGAFVEVALSPPPDAEAATRPARDKAEPLIRAQVVPAADVATIKSFAEYSVVMLANVPRLPATAAKALAGFVSDGGGLLVAPGEDADPAFYNTWMGPDNRPVLGCRLKEIITDAQGVGPEETSARVAAHSIDHPALKLLSDPAVSDLATGRVRRHWLLEYDSTDKTITRGATLDNGHPWMVQRTTARGLAVTLALPLGRGFSDLPMQDCFVPLVHELTYYLSEPLQAVLNLTPGEQAILTVPGTIKEGDLAEVVAPDGRRTPARLQLRQGEEFLEIDPTKAARARREPPRPERKPDVKPGDRPSGEPLPRPRWQAVYGMTQRPGMYRLVLPDHALGELATRPAVAATAPANLRGLPFVVLDNPDESRMKRLAGEDYARAGQYVQVERVDSLGELSAALLGHAAGSEIWAYIALAVLGLLLAETALARWIAVRRRTHLAVPVSFGNDQVNADDFRRVMRHTLDAPSKEAANR